MRLHLPDGDFGGFIFDCDGTLADTMPVHYRAWLRTFKDIGAPFRFDEDKFYSMGGVPTFKITAILNREYGTDFDSAKVGRHKEEVLMSLLANSVIDPIRPVCDFARQAAAADKPLAVASGGYRYIVDHILKSIGMYELFAGRIVTPEMVANGKPAPDMFLRAAEIIRVAPEKCLVFEDAVPGIQAAKAAGMQVVVVPSRDS
jgi:HAD superfamily hydrolase (TIGR01509 family)